MRRLDDLIDTGQPGIDLLRQWARNAAVPCEMLPPSPEREDVLLAVRVTTRLTLGTLTKARWREAVARRYR